MKNIIIYATKHGCTEKAAELLKSKLSGETSMVNIMKETVPPLNGFDSVMLGGSIYMGRIQKQLTDFMEKNLQLLLKKNLGLFICAGSPDIEARIKELESSFPSELFNHATCKEVFGYEIDYSKLGFLEKTIMKAVKGGKESTSELSEEKIKAFAELMSA